MAELSRDPQELESRAVEVAALAAGISRAQALQALDAAATLLRRATALRIAAALEHNAALSSPAEREVVGRIIRQVVAGVDST